MGHATGHWETHDRASDFAFDLRETDQVERAVWSLLRQSPTALVGALTDDASVRLVPLPPSLTISPDHPRLTGSSVTGILVAADQAVVARLWWQARTLGSASAAVHLAAAPAVGVTLHIVDLRPQHGVMLVVVADQAPEVGASVVHAGDTWRPHARFARVVKDGSALVIDADPAFEQLLGWAKTEIVGRRMLEFVHPDDHDCAVEHWVQMSDFPGPSRPVRLRHRHKDGRWIWVEVTNHNRLAEPSGGHVVADMVDVSEEVAAVEAVRARQQLLEQVTESIRIGLLHAGPDGRLLYVNPRFTEITGLEAGNRLADWPSLASPQHRGAVRGALRAGLGGVATDAMIDSIRPEGDVRHCSLTVRPLADPTGTVTGVTGSVEDVTASVVERRELEVRAATDSLTGCLNRSATLALAQDALDELGDPGTTGAGLGGVAAIFVDVDNLKVVNDELGHGAGDALLTEVSDRIHGAVRARDIVGRFGGDEFVVVSSNVRSAEHAMSVARWMASRIMSTFTVDGHTVELRASLGVAWTDSPGVQAAWLVRQADAAMYISKRDGQCQPVMSRGRAGPSQ